MTQDEARWWVENCEQARLTLAELFASQDDVVPTYRHAQTAATNLLLIAAPLLLLDPALDEPPDVWAALESNITRLALLARRLYEMQPVDEMELNAGRFVTMCFEPLGSTSYIALWVVRTSLTTLAVVNRAAIYDELWDEPGYDAWCLAVAAHNWFGDIDDTTESALWVRPNQTLIGRGWAHEISNAVTSAGGTDPMSRN